MLCVIKFRGVILLRQALIFSELRLKKTLKLLIPARFSVRTLLRYVLMWHVLADMESYNKSFGAISWA